MQIVSNIALALPARPFDFYERKILWLILCVRGDNRRESVLTVSDSRVVYSDHCPICRDGDAQLLFSSGTVALHTTRQGADGALRYKRIRCMKGEFRTRE